MAFNNEIENVWKEGKGTEELLPLVGEDLQAIISSRVRKEFKRVGEFVWAAIVYQIILYSFLPHTLVRHWGDTRTMLLCLAGVVLYLPLTIAFIRRVRKLFGGRKASDETVPDVFHKVENEHA